MSNQISAEEIIKKYSDTVYRLAYSTCKNKDDADDIFQEVFLRYIKYKPSFRNEEHKKAWFIRVTLNCCKSLYSSAERKMSVPLEDIKDSNETYDSHYELLDLVKSLPFKYRAVIHLFYYEELSIKEIAKLTKQRESTIRTQLTRARKLLRERLEEDEL